ncbi:hypothetical protein Lmede01_12240 [Leuconostoc mesenteroides subsp. dextranicum]|jgi:hypothetical protein|nr:hypothetical protein LME01_08050 [Leuconostoc mesenteroides subsp. mesenteroides]GLX33246.1 hypothetical protein Lmede01_12240 [Leuconostoc mesenteroides subsp. dextranicum]
MIDNGEKSEVTILNGSIFLAVKPNHPMNMINVIGIKESNRLTINSGINVSFLKKRISASE